MRRVLASLALALIVIGSTFSLREEADSVCWAFATVSEEGEITDIEMVCNPPLIWNV